MTDAVVIPFSSEQSVKPHTDEALALAFAARHAEHVRYVAKWGRWMIYDGAVWMRDETLQIFSFARALCRDDAADAPANARARILSAKTYAAVVTMARSDPAIAATVDQWDADPMALNCDGEALMLDSDIRRTAIPGDYFTKSTAVEAGRRLPALARFPRYRHRRRRRPDRLPAARLRLLPDRADHRARAVLPARHRRQRQKRLPVDHRRRHGRLCPHRAHRDLHRQQQRPPSDRSRRTCRARGW